ncbi:hypothetical protein EDEG_03357 [Edhazardia aedis USNM 41457]|uniref:BING4 C-terminal domain-containing protein n=1 Tax=Edhazardia aedis (strain USNM 41457) TaxID=1003232 RepID=J8ZR82_EDHAE|nr:hypothetical protein EDEG_03357 [Edhazardia aedis USNM 41457]|eukprot:EJW02203.1 hypothetical protein EDEG_03357 [Edhazardia aedis USNM 41457]
MSFREEEDESNQNLFKYKNAYIQKHIPKKLQNILIERELPFDYYYHTKYDSTGRYKLVYNSQGYQSVIDTKKDKLQYEQEISDHVYDGTFLHNELYTALAQNKAVYTYKQGVETQCIRELKNMRKISFMPYHFLLTCLQNDGVIKYFDTSIGKVVATVDSQFNNNSYSKSTASSPEKTKLYGKKSKTNGSFNYCLEINPANGITYIGHQNGTVTLHKPSQKEYILKVLCHTSLVKNIQIDRTGNYMITNGIDNVIKIWDIRNLYQSYNKIDTQTNHEFLKLSHNNYLATGFKNKIHIYKDIFNTNYKNIEDALHMQETTHGSLVRSLCYCPYQDILSAGHTHGFKSLIVPGSGDPIFDSCEDTPFRTKKQRQNLEVRRLLEKIPFELISEENDIIGKFKFDSNVNKEPVIVKKQEYREKTALDRFYNE